MLQQRGGDDVAAQEVCRMAGGDYMQEPNGVDAVPFDAEGAPSAMVVWMRGGFTRDWVIEAGCVGSVAPTPGRVAAMAR